MKEIRVQLKNKPGELAKLCETLERSGVNIITLFGGGFDRWGVVYLITDDENTAYNALLKKGYQPELFDVIVARIEDKPGSLRKMAYALAENGINIEALYLLDRVGDFVRLVVKVDDHEKAKEVLEREGYI